MNRQQTVLEHVVASSRKLAPKSKQQYLRRVRDYLDFAGTAVRGWTAASLEAWRNHLLDERDIKPKSANLYMAAVIFASRRMEELGLGRNFAKGAERVRVEASTELPKKKSLTLVQARKLVGATWRRDPVSMRDRAMFLVALQSGFRRNELVSIEFDMMQGGEITVLPKGGRELHTVRVGQDAWSALGIWSGWLQRNDVELSGRVFRRLRKSVDEQAPWTIGHSLSGDGFNRILKSRAEEAGLRVEVHPHMLRHTFTSIALQSGVPLWRIKKALGHRGSVTEDYISDLNETPIGDLMPSFLEAA